MQVTDAIGGEMKGPNLEAARAFLSECQKRDISVMPERDNWRLRLWGPTHNAAWVEANHHLKAASWPC